MSFCIKEHKFGCSLHWAETQKSYFLGPAEGAKAERKKSCLGVMIMSHPGESGEAQFEIFTIKQSCIIELLS